MALGRVRAWQPGERRTEQLTGHARRVDCPVGVTSVRVQGRWRALFKDKPPRRGHVDRRLTTAGAWRCVRKRFIKFNSPEYYYIKTCPRAAIKLLSQLLASCISCTFSVFSTQCDVVRTRLGLAAALGTATRCISSLIATGQDARGPPSLHAFRWLVSVAREHLPHISVGTSNGGRVATARLPMLSCRK